MMGTTGNPAVMSALALNGTMMIKRENWTEQQNSYFTKQERIQLADRLETPIN